MSAGAEFEEFDEFVRGRSVAMLRSAWLLTGDGASAEDLVQSALVKVWLAWPTITRRDGVDAYSRTVLVRTFLSWRRKRSTGELPTGDLPDRALAMTSVADSTEAVVERHLLVVGLLRALPRRQRLVLVLRFFDDLTEAQTAAAVGTSIGTVKSQTAKAMSALRRGPERTIPPNIQAVSDS